MTDLRRWILANGLVFDSPTATWQPRDIVIDGGVIVELREPGQNAGEAVGVDVVDVGGHLVLPGLINGHTHAHNNLLKGAPDCRSLESHINAMSAVGQWSPEDLYLSTSLGIIEMLTSGTTTVNDMVRAPSQEHLAAVVQAYADAGMRAVIAPAVSDVHFVSAVPGLAAQLSPDARAQIEQIPMRTAAEGLAFAGEAISAFHGAGDGRVSIAVGPLIADACSDDLLVGCAELSRDAGVVLHEHLLESKYQALNGFVRGGGKSWVAHLADIGALGEQMVFAHAVWLLDDEVRQLADAGASVVHNPASNMKIGSGLAPVKDYLSRGLNTALATDGAASSDNLDLFAAMWLTALLSHGRGPDTARWLAAEEVFEMATGNGARALHLSPSAGLIAVGAAADLTVLTRASAAFVPINDLLRMCVYGSAGAAVRLVVVAGRVVLEAGRLTSIDQDAIIERAAAASARLGLGSPTRLGAEIDAALIAMAPALDAVPFPIRRYLA